MLRKNFVQTSRPDKFSLSATIFEAVMMLDKVVLRSSSASSFLLWKGRFSTSLRSLGKSATTNGHAVLLCGKVTVTCVPIPTVLSIRTVPSERSTMALQMERPSPAPPLSRLRD